MIWWSGTHSLILSGSTPLLAQWEMKNRLKASSVPDPRSGDAACRVRWRAFAGRHTRHARESRHC